MLLVIDADNVNLHLVVVQFGVRVQKHARSNSLFRPYFVRASASYSVQVAQTAALAFALVAASHRRLAFFGELR